MRCPSVCERDDDLTLNYSEVRVYMSSTDVKVLIAGSYYLLQKVTACAGSIVPAEKIIEPIAYHNIVGWLIGTRQVGELNV